MRSNFFKINNKGFSLIEVILSLFIFIAGVTTLSLITLYAQEGVLLNSSRSRAVLYAEESAEAMQSIRDRDFSELLPGVYGLTKENGRWELVANSDTNGIYTRQITISAVDEDTRSITTYITWDQLNGVQGEVTVESYVSNWVSPEGTIPEGDPTGANTNWCEPELSLTGYAIAGQADRKTVSAIAGEAYLGTGGVASDADFRKVLISQDDPPELSDLGTYNLASNYSVNDIYAEANTAYLATTDPAKEVIIVNTASRFTETGYFNMADYGGWPTNSSSYRTRSVYVKGTVGYMAHGKRIYTFNIGVAGASKPELSNISLTGWWTPFNTAYISEIIVVGNYLYASLNDNNYEIAIVDVTNPSKLAVASYTSTNDEQVQDLFVSPDGNRVYFGTNVSESGEDEFFILDSENKASELDIISSLDTGAMSVRGITVVPDRAIIVGAGGEEYQVIDISDEILPEKCGGMNSDFDIWDIASVTEDDLEVFSYIITADSDFEFKVIEGGYDETGGIPGEPQKVIIRN